MKQIIKQCIEQLRSQRMLTMVSIAGTALSILLIMVVVMIEQVKVVPFAPESNRDRSLHVSAAVLESKENPEICSAGPLSYKTAMAMCGDLPGAEATSIYTKSVVTVTVEATGKHAGKSYQRMVDDNFWRVFDFTFVSGKPFDKAAFDSGQKVAVIDESTARRLFGTTDAAGRDFLLSYQTFRVCGVVKDVTKLAQKSFANIWVPVSATNAMNDTWGTGGFMGNLAATILAKSPDDFETIRKEFNNRVAVLNNGEVGKTDQVFNMLGRPYTQEIEAYAIWSNVEPDVDGERRSRLIVYAILLIIPAINLSGMTESRLRRRVEEIGVRRAFGCKRNSLMMQLVGENLLITIAAGIIGWAMSVVFTILFSGSLFSEKYFDSASDVAASVDMFMLVKPSTFLWALLFCFVLNLLSSGIPAWKASRTNIVNAINKR